MSQGSIRLALLKGGSITLLEAFDISKSVSYMSFCLQTEKENQERIDNLKSAERNKRKNREEERVDVKRGWCTKIFLKDKTN